MLLEAPQIWRMKRYNVLETELVYKTGVREVDRLFFLYTSSVDYVQNPHNGQLFRISHCAIFHS